MAVKEKTQDKPSRIWQYLKETHKWENYVFLFFSVVVLVVGLLIVTGTLTIKDDAWLIGDYPKAFAWCLVGMGGLFALYGLYPFFKPALPEFKKVSWLTLGKFAANAIRVLLFLVIFALLFLLYDAFISLLLARILG